MQVKLESINGQPYIQINSKKFNLTTGYSMYLALEELRSLNTGLEVNFESFKQLNELIVKVNKIVSDKRHIFNIN